METEICIENCVCERAGKCPVYTKIVEKNPHLLRTYKELYCEKEDGMKKCRRYQIFNVFNKCPDCVLPNSYISDAEVLILLGNVAFSTCRVEKFLDEIEVDNDN